MTQNSFDDIATYVAPSPSYTDVFVDVVGALSNPPKRDKMWGKEGWKVEPIVKTTAIGIAPDGGNLVKVRSSATANSKFAPAKAYATGYGENGGTNDVYVLAFARANGKPGPVFGTLISAADGTAISGGDVATAGNAAVLSSSRATGGTGITIAKGYGYAQSARGAFVGIDTRANSAKWYASPGAAFAGGQAIGNGGHVITKQDTRARADLGLAVAGTINVAKSNGVQPAWWDAVTFNGATDSGGGNVVFMNLKTQTRADVGASVGGSINIGSTENGKIVELNDNTDAGTAVGDATSGALNIAVSNNNDVLIGDYDNSDATQNEVLAKVRGRGEAQGAQVNIGGWSGGWGRGRGSGAGVGWGGRGSAVCGGGAKARGESADQGVLLGVELWAWNSSAGASRALCGGAAGCCAIRSQQLAAALPAAGRGLALDQSAPLRR